MYSLIHVSLYLTKLNIDVQCTVKVKLDKQIIELINENKYLANIP